MFSHNLALVSCLENFSESKLHHLFFPRHLNKLAFKDISLEVKVVKEYNARSDQLS